MDSLYLEPGDVDRDGLRIEKGKNCVAPEEEDTTGHGTEVFDTLQFVAGNSTFSFYRVIVEGSDGDGVAKRSNVADAIYEASQKGVDVLNISLGVCHSEEEGHHCGELCRIADEARLAIEKDDVTIVAATGNDSKADAVTCPALVSDVIGVGGYVSICENDVDCTGKSSQYWVETDQLYGPFCGQRGCHSGEECSKNRKEKLWDHNVSFHNAVPDVLAPVVRGTKGESHLSVHPGTSFAAPLISGRIATVLSDMRLEEGKDIEPRELQRALKLTGVEIEESHMVKYHEERFFDHLNESGAE